MGEGKHMQVAEECAWGADFDDQGGPVEMWRPARSSWKARNGWYRRRSPESRRDRDAYIETLKAQYGTPELMLSWLSENGTIVLDPRRDMDWLRTLCREMHRAGLIVRDKDYAQTSTSAIQAFKLPRAAIAKAEGR